MRTCILAALIAVGLTLTGCNTVAGLGRDVASAGDAVSNTADKNK